MELEDLMQESIKIMENDFYGKNIKNVRGDAYTMSAYHVLWPIPRPAILANSLAVLNQNKGYSGAETNIAPLDKPNCASRTKNSANALSSRFNFLQSSQSR